MSSTSSKRSKKQKVPRDQSEETVEPKLKKKMKHAEEAVEKEQRADQKKANEEEKSLQFDEMGLDGRLIKAIADLGWKEPTLIQEKAIPLAIEKRKDILGRGRTGSGKTGAYLIPIIHSILASKKKNPTESVKLRAMIIAPSKELCRQIEKHAMGLSKYCLDKVTTIDIGSTQANELKLLLASPYDMVIGTPSRILEQIKVSFLK